MEKPKLEVRRHVKYWQRCLKSLLPTQYTSTDSSRMTLALFILSALDLLGEGPDTFPTEERDRCLAWILKCQHPHGGFSGSTNHRYPDVFYEDGVDIEPANLPATYFAIMSLGLVGGLDAVRRAECLRWLRRLQRPDGSFGEWVLKDGKIGGGMDMRYCYCAIAVRWVLGGDGLGEGEDIDVDKLVDHIRSGQTYDGGLSESSEHEAHALSILGRLPPRTTTSVISQPPNSSETILPGLTNLPATIRWLVSRQIDYSDGTDENTVEEDPSTVQMKEMVGIYKYSNIQNASELADIIPHDPEFIGFNGRCNKRADTCYSFWVAASLSILGEAQVLNAELTQQFLFAKTQHLIGGFGKTPGDPPGLATLATLKAPELKDFDPVLCIGTQTKANIVKFREAAVNLNRHEQRLRGLELGAAD
ncbi:hypothetical protein B7494_g1197 [Chlorociboria aeruginascens]|nr:hypothetical protein B7494_g1197 [Chlorociboria aeruginascens]